MLIPVLVVKLTVIHPISLFITLEQTLLSNCFPLNRVLEQDILFSDPVGIVKQIFCLGQVSSWTCVQNILFFAACAHTQPTSEHKHCLASLTTAGCLKTRFSVIVVGALCDICWVKRDEIPTMGFIRNLWKTEARFRRRQVMPCCEPEKVSDAEGEPYEGLSGTAYPADIYYPSPPRNDASPYGNNDVIAYPFLGYEDEEPVIAQDEANAPARNGAFVDVDNDDNSDSDSDAGVPIAMYQDNHLVGNPQASPADGNPLPFANMADNDSEDEEPYQPALLWNAALAAAQARAALWAEADDADDEASLGAVEDWDEAAGFDGEAGGAWLHDGDVMMEDVGGFGVVDQVGELGVDNQLEGFVQGFEDADQLDGLGFANPLLQGDNGLYQDNNINMANPFNAQLLSAAHHFNLLRLHENRVPSPSSSSEAADNAADALWLHEIARAIYSLLPDEVVSLGTVWLFPVPFADEARHLTNLARDAQRMTVLWIAAGEARRGPAGAGVADVRVEDEARVQRLVGSRPLPEGADVVVMSILEGLVEEMGRGIGGGRAKLQFSARPSDAMLRKNTPPATDANPDPVPDCGPVWVEFLTDKQFGVGQIRQFAKYIISNHYKRGIMVTHAALSPAARKSLASVEGMAKIECFLEDDLLVNITHHELVPRHVLLSRDEKTALLKRYRLKETQLPRILAKDPVARYLGLRRGQVVKIIRASETAGRYASYRLCV
ncbi:hypothetical protein CDD80_5270 [Ophiocordyceps camponoti-rufipedis]|uniref:RNA polymerase subunit H/Rpb5 C-terminal domain-containing protein n=1 Tax=Ophiocordyceps camponoti-rufipedis TaxID=2004952 RepID=A0A2C5ZBL3_9HYPO|nr:hypothetical protein CDD80_5270 [Ophiocordyceps camponoti-rufipedis]